MNYGYPGNIFPENPRQSFVCSTKITLQPIGPFPTPYPHSWTEHRNAEHLIILITDVFKMHITCQRSWLFCNSIVKTYLKGEDDKLISDKPSTWYLTWYLNSIFPISYYLTNESVMYRDICIWTDHYTH